MKRKEKPKYTMWQNIRYMFSMAWKHQKSVIIFCIICAVLDIGLNLTELFVAPEILKRVEQTAPMAELLGTILVFAGLLFVLKTAKFYTKESQLYSQIYVRMKIIDSISEKQLMTSYPNTENPNFLRKKESALNACPGNNSSTEHIWVTLTKLLASIGGFLAYLLLLTRLNGFLIVIVIFTSVVGFLVSRHVQKWQNEHRDQWDQLWERMRYLNQKSRSVELAKDIRIFGLGNWLADLYNGIIRSIELYGNKRERNLFWASFVDVLLAFLRNGIAYAYLLYLALNQNLSASEFLLYFTAISGFNAWVTEILSQCSGLYQECLDISHVQEFLNFPEPFRFEGGKPIPKANGYELKLSHVTFRYPGTDCNLFEDLNLTIHSGERLAMVGLNGAGKTSLVKLLCGFYDPDQGQVLLNGQDIREFNRREYYGLLSAVYQEHSLLDMTVAENVATAVDADCSEKVQRCMEMAGLGTLADSLPKGLQTPVGRDVYLDGVLFSGGQTQRLLLARALYKDGPILILDEPTAALDPIAENDIYIKYKEMTAGKTSVFISHRLASTRFCDRILFLQNGRIVEEGTHDSLLKQNGEYAKLFQVQSRYYQEGREFR